jgi:hypothetical protein
MNDQQPIFKIPPSTSSGLGYYAIVKMMNSGCGKNLREVFEESSQWAITNLMKHIQPDTGGTPGTIPQRLLDLVSEIKKLSDDDAATLLYRREDERAKSIRLGCIRRSALLRVRGLYVIPTYEQFEEEVVKMVDTTLTEYNKRADRIDLIRS